MTYSLRLLGKVIPKKNLYSPRRGGAGIYIRNQDGLDRLALQIPAELRDLKLKHPDITFRFWAPTGRFDRDNCVTTLLDILQTYKVIETDSVAKCNGTFTVLPAVKHEEWITEIYLKENPNNGFR